MKHFEEFKISGYSFGDRDSPSDLCSALGRAALGHAVLDRGVSAAIDMVATQQWRGPPRISQDWSMAQKLRVLERLLVSSQRRRRFNVGNLSAIELGSELCRLLRSADAVYRDAVEPRLEGQYLRSETPSDLPDRIMDVADFLAYAEESLKEFS